MSDPLFWLGFSILLVALSLTAVLIAALPALRELARAARSAEKLFDTLRREFPPTLESIRLTGLEISELTDDLNDGVKNASQAIAQVNHSLRNTQQQIDKVRVGTRGLVAGMKAAWQSWQQYPPRKHRTHDRFIPSQRSEMDLNRLPDRDK